MKSKLFTLGILLLILGIGGRIAHAQDGCARVDQNSPPQYLAYEGLEQSSTPTKGESRERIVLRFRNNTNCDLTLRMYESPPNRFLLRDEFPEGVRLETLRYSIEYREPLPRPKKRVVVDETFYEFRLFAGRSVTFTVPLNRFDHWIQIDVPFEYDWDQLPRRRGGTVAVWRTPSHDAFFGNVDLPEDIFARTKVCLKVGGCKPTRSNKSLDRSAGRVFRN